MIYPDDVPVLTDGVVTLRAHRQSDVPRIVEQCRDAESVRWTTVPTPYAEGDAHHWIGTVISGGWVGGTTCCFAIEHDGWFAGTVDLRVRGGGEGEIGFGLHPAARGQGVMRRALNLLLDWGFVERGLAVVWWRAFVGNWASRRTAWSLGFTFGPTVPGLLPHREERRDGWTGWLGAEDARVPTVRWLTVPVIEVDGVRLRPWTEADGRALVETALDPAYEHWIPQGPLPRSEADVPAYLERVRFGQATGHRVPWCVADAATDIVLGGVAVFGFEDDGDDRTAELGYWSHPAGRGRGAMTTAVRAAVRHALAVEADGGLGVRRLEVHTDVANGPSRRLAERAGFVHVATDRGATRSADGSWHDSVRYDLLRSDAEMGAHLR